MYENYSHIISIYGSHDASFTFIDKDKNISVLEYERFVKKRYAFYSEKFDDRPGMGSNPLERKLFIEYLKTKLYSLDIKIILYNELSENDINYLKTHFKNANFIKMGHHTAHAASGYYTSPFESAFVISIDGGGDELGKTIFTKTFIGDDNNLIPYESFDIEFGGPYGMLASPISEIKPGADSNLNSLSYAGKIMGICAYGDVIHEWIEPIKKFYKSKNINLLSLDLGLNLNFNNLSGKIGYNLAATSQKVFEELFFELFWDKIIESKKDVILVGGCALNVLLNQKLKEQLLTINKKLYVPSNPNDCGLSLGQFLSYTKIKINDNIVYNGFEILDKHKLNDYVKEYDAKLCTIEELVNLLSIGKIIGIINNGSEIGPRALGNRSIICDPSIKNMKDILNKKVKFREWFRPFAPVCRSEDKDKYFDKVFDSKFMSYAPIVKEQYKEKLCSITHIDGTARLQTLNNNDHDLFYSILTEMENKKMIPVILNTSFNIKGKPILTTIDDALHVLDNTELDHVYTNGYLFSKKK
jgi:carbamoyltransferase